jgi:hypothetical protein
MREWLNSHPIPVVIAVVVVIGGVVALYVR